MKKIKILLFFLFPMPGLAAFNTAQLAAPSALPDCIDYCYIGQCIYMTCGGVCGQDVLGRDACCTSTTPRVSHRLPDFVVSSYEHPGEITWTEGQAVYGALSVLALNAIVRIASVIPVLTVGGGRDTNSIKSIDPDDDARGRPSSIMHFKEVSVLGNPYVKALSNDDEDGDPETSDQSYCETGVDAFEYFFQSEIDGYTWRYNTIERLYPQSWIPGLREVGIAPIIGTWGSVYPRHGFLYSNEDPKAAAVMAQRAIDVVTRRSQPHIYNHEESIEPSDEDTDKWAMVFPHIATQCVTFGHTPNYGINNTTQRGNYGWVYWARHECCINMKGTVIARIETAPICLN